MTPGARIAASIELLDAVLRAWQEEKRYPADKILDHYFRTHRYIGSKDRGSIAELIYWVLRHKAALAWWLDKYQLQVHARHFVLAALMLRNDFTPDTLPAAWHEGKYGPLPLIRDEMAFCKQIHGQPMTRLTMPPWVRLNYAEWMHPMLEESFGQALEEEMAVLNEEAPLDLRANLLKTTREELVTALRDLGMSAEPGRMSPTAVRLKKREPVFILPQFKAGHFEVQDEGSQLIAMLVDAGPGQKIIDFCAGAGGKTLALAAAMKNKGRILAWDTSAKRLDQIKPRLRRAGVGNVQVRAIASEHDAFIKRHKYSADRVLVDAPCSGSGTWRRNPDLKWRFTPKDLEEVVDVQQRILESAARLVKPGGRLIYATCSIFKIENERQIERFLKEKTNFRVVCAQKIWDKSSPDELMGEVSYLWVTPRQDGVDGFFAAVLEKTAQEQET